MDKNIKNPEIRFKGFTEDWENKKIGEILTEKNRSIQLEDDKEYQLVTVKRRNNGVVSRGYLKGKDILVKNYFQVETGDYIISKRQVVHGSNGLVPKNLNNAVVSNEYLIVASNKNITTEYWSLISNIPTIYKKFFLSSYGVDIEKLVFDVEDWKKRNIIIPQLNEQNKIVDFFNYHVNLINLHQQKYDKLVILKKAMLVKMFPTNEALVPEIRFKGFSGNWVEKKLGEIVPLRGGFAFKSDNFIINGIPIVKISNILASGQIGGKFNYYKEVIADENYTLPNNAALLAMSGATTGKVSILSNPTEKKVYQNQRVGYFEDRDLVNYQFISAILRSNLFSDKINSILTTGAQPNISSKEIDFFEFYVPTDRLEQQKIGSYFKNLDNQIALHKKQLDKLNTIKKACFSKMFVGQD